MHTHHHGGYGFSYKETGWGFCWDSVQGETGLRARPKSYETVTLTITRPKTDESVTLKIARPKTDNRQTQGWWVCNSNNHQTQGWWVCNSNNHQARGWIVRNSNNHQAWGWIVRNSNNHQTEDWCVCNNHNLGGVTAVCQAKQRLWHSALIYLSPNQPQPAIFRSTCPSLSVSLFFYRRLEISAPQRTRSTKESPPMKTTLLGDHSRYHWQLFPRVSVYQLQKSPCFDQSLLSNLAYCRLTLFGVRNETEFQILPICAHGPISAKHKSSGCGSRDLIARFSLTQLQLPPSKTPVYALPWTCWSEAKQPCR